MADKLIFPIGFDLETGSKEALKNWDAVQQQLQKQFDKKPLKLKVELDTKGVGLDDLKEYIKLSKEAAKATQNATMAAKRAADIRSKNAMARKRESDARVAEATETERITRTKANATMAELRLQDARQNGIRSINAQSKAYGTQTSYINRLIKRFAVYASLHSAFNFLNNIRAVTAEFEMQRVALGAIIGSAERASSLFNQIQQAAVKSPFEIRELVSYTRQLAAYKIETDELFETMMRLSDISAGLGVSMERITLAYGQIRATGYLRASEVRQLTEAGIPIIEELAEKMSQLRGETYSAADVMALISERAISFGMVKDIFDDMTSAGGMFYKMQEKQSQTLEGQWRNMKDAISIMFDEIGRTPEVMDLMRGIVDTVKLLAKNWRNVWEVMKTLGIAYAAYITYQKLSNSLTKLGVAATTRMNAAVAREAALTARLNLLKQNNNVVTKYQIWQTKALIAANYKLATSTNFVTRAWNRLKIAFLSNPFGIALSVIGTVLTAFQLFKDATEDFTNEVETDIYASIEATKGLIKEYDFRQKTIKPLVDEFEELRKKTQRTADEQKRYNDLLIELSSKAPDIVAKAGENQDNIFETLVDDITQRRMLLRQEREALEATLRDYKYRVDRLTKDLLRGGSYVNKDGTWTFVKYSSEKILQMSSELQELNNKILETEKAIAAVNEGLNPSGKSLFTGWKAQVAKFEKDGTRLFWDTELTNYTSLNDVLEETAKRYKEAKENSDLYAKSLESLRKKQGTEDQQEEIQKQKERADVTKDLAYQLLQYYNQLDLLDKSSKDNGLSKFKDQINDLTNAHKKFIDLRKYMSKEDALDNIAIFFPSLGDFEPTYENMVARLEELRDDVRAKLAKSPKDESLIDINREAEKALANVRFDNLKTELEKKLARLSQEISKTKTAKEFYDKILGLTGDRELSATFTMSVYGESGEDLAKKTVEQLQAAFEGIDLSEAINFKNYQVNWQKVTEIYKAHEEDMLEANKKTAEELIKNAQKVSADQIQQWVKELEQAKSYADKRVELAQQTAERIRDIEQSNIPQEQKNALVEQYRQREEKQTSALQYEAFKNSPAYVEMFNNLDNVSTKMLEHLREKLQELQSEWQNLDPTQLKELQSRLNAIDEKLASRNPFKALANSIKEYYEQRKQGSRADAERALTEALQKQAEAHKVLEERIKAVNEAQERYDATKAAAGEHSTLTILAKLQLDNARQQLQTQQQITNETDNSVESAQELVSAWDKIKAGGLQALDGINEITQSLTQTASQMYDAFGGFGGDEADNEFFKTLVDGIGQTAGGLTNLVKGVMSGDPIAVIQGIGDAISGIANLAYADRIKAANKEIARQKELLDNLSYAYSRLEKVSEELFGGEYIENYQHRMRNLQAQQAAYLKQAEAERSKGKKADEEKIKDYENQARDTADAIKDMYGEVAERFLGSDLTSIARELARSWIDAKKEIGDATKAIEERIAEMIENLIIEAGAAEIAKKIMQPFYDEVEKLSEDADGLTAHDIATLAEMIPELSESMNVGLTHFFETLKAAGYDLTKTSGDLTGISKDIATASEESILGLAAGINTQNFYISQIHANVALITQWVQSGGMATQGVNISDLITLQNQHLSHLPNIAANTASILAECKKILADTTRIANNLGNVVKPVGVKSGFALHTSL